ncbi:asparaginase [Micrococcus flavus]|uniref:L-asparaginase II n=1 Tax=Micrococcus flavus TaxID=384602 RepID=A0A4Y8X1B7_9MICC|nr:asparaginase [Micrococcus flavus]MBB4882013.1 L-asparaginase II [Micrococcus flavus]TFI02876.1 asparaginase [Micrococcus flavus]GGK46741.1 asparaginase [Micrococcus flavus]
MTSPAAPAGQTFALADAVELVHVVRNGFVESRTAGAAVVTGPDGAVLAALGPVDAPVYPRSTLKPFQAIAALRHGARLEGEALAIACGSHRGTVRHQELAARMLADAGLDASALQCPPDWPADADELVRYAAEAGSEARRTPLAYNCSGKHAGFLAACAAAGHDVGTYLDPQHPVQREVEAVIAEYCGEPVAHTGVDGCGAPAAVVSLTGLARGIGRVSGAPSRPDAEPHAAAVAEAMLAHPWAVHGETNSNTVVMRELGLLAKLGADGVTVMGAPDGTAVAVKALDGGTRAGDLVALALMGRFAPDHVDAERLAAVVGQVRPKILGRGDPVGSVELSAAVRAVVEA